MAVSDVAIANLALQKLGTGRIASFDEDSTAAVEINACYSHLRRVELRRHSWNFARTRASLAASATAPAFDFDYAYPLPSDYLRLLPPNVNGLDWQIESHQGQNAILTNETGPLYVVYLADVTDPTRFDVCFDEMLACRIADHICEKITGSTTKGAKAMEDYKIARAEARRVNAFENIAGETPEDPWLAARR